MICDFGATANKQVRGKQTNKQVSGKQQVRALQTNKQVCGSQQVRAWQANTIASKQGYGTTASKMFAFYNLCIHKTLHVL